MFNLDYASNGLGRNWFPAKWLACCAHQSLLFQHIRKSFLLCKRVRPRNHWLLPSVSVVSLSQCRGTLDFLLWKQPPYFSNISESEKLRFSIFQTFKNCQVSPKNQWLFHVLKCVCGQWVMCQKSWVFGVFWEPRSGALRTSVISGSSLVQVLIPAQEWSTYT